MDLVISPTTAGLRASSVTLLHLRKSFFPQFILPIAFERHSFVAPSRIGGACQSASLRFNMYVQLFAGRNFVGIVQHRDGKLPTVMSFVQQVGNAHPLQLLTIGLVPDGHSDRQCRCGTKKFELL